MELETSYGDEYLLFYESYCGLWIYNWFNEKVQGFDRKVDNVYGIKVEHELVEEFFHECLSAILNPRGYVREHIGIMKQSDRITDRYVGDVQNVAGKILNSVLVNKNDMSFVSEFRLGVEK